MEEADELAAVISFMLGQALLIVANVGQRLLWTLVQRQRPEPPVSTSASASASVEIPSATSAATSPLTPTSPASALESDLQSERVSVPVPVPVPSSETHMPHMLRDALVSSVSPVSPPSLWARAIYACSDVAHVCSILLPVAQMWRGRGGEGGNRSNGSSNTAGRDAAGAAVAGLRSRSVWADLANVFLSKSALVALVDTSLT